MGKAKVYLMLKEIPGPNYDVELTASSGWFKPINNHSLHNVKVSDEYASADVKAAE